jgi:type 1 glutamine amidotransferase
MLAAILSRHHGFQCTVLFAVNPKTGEIDPNTLDNIPGLRTLARADLLVVCTRFRNLPDEQFQFIDAYLQSGKPVVGIRPAVVAFRNRQASRFFKYSSDNTTGDYAGGFGQQVLGSTWISHHGDHGKESSRGVPVEGSKNHPILRGVGTMWGPTDVYTIRTPIPHDGQVLVMGQVLQGMTPNAPVSPKAPMPLAWVKRYLAPKGQGRVFMSTMGASEDFLDESFRRLVVNGCLWAAGLEDRIPEKTCVDFVGIYSPTPFGFNRFRKGLTPAALAADLQSAVSSSSKPKQPAH